MGKLKDRRGRVNRVIAVLLVLIAVMLGLISVPAWQRFRYRSEKTACIQAMKSARDGLIIEYLSRWDGGTVDEAMQTLDEVLPERANICPSGGTVYLIRGENGIFEPVCGLHDDDVKRRTRLNASRGLELLTEELRTSRRESKEEPETLEIQLNGQPLACERVRERVPLRRGTATTEGYEGVVAFYAVAGDGELDAGSVRKGQICYFVYADEYYCAIWQATDGWTGDAYRTIQ